MDEGIVDDSLRVLLKDLGYVEVLKRLNMCVLVGLTIQPNKASVMVKVFNNFTMDFVENLRRFGGLPSFEIVSKDRDHEIIRWHFNY